MLGRVFLGRLLRCCRQTTSLAGVCVVWCFHVVRRSRYCRNRWFRCPPHTCMLVRIFLVSQSLFSARCSCPCMRERKFLIRCAISWLSSWFSLAPRISVLAVVIPLWIPFSLARSTLRTGFLSSSYCLLFFSPFSAFFAA